MIFMIIIIIILLLNMFLLLSAKYTKNKEKCLSFECGFNSFVLYRSSFSIQFFKILLIFLLFDMEIIIILPFPLSVYLCKFMYFIFLLIMFFLIFGLYFEWVEGSLEWLN